MDAVNDWLHGEKTVNCGAFVISSSQNEIDNHLIGPFAGMLNATLILEDTQDLNSVAHIANYFSNQEDLINEIVFLGSEMRFSRLDKEIIAKAAAQANL